MTSRAVGRAPVTSQAVGSTAARSRAAGSLVAGLDAGGSSLKAWVAEVGGRVLAQVSVPTPTLRPAPDRAEFDPAVWEAAARSALQDVISQAPGAYVGVTASSLRQGFVLLDGSGRPLGNGLLNSDRTGAAYQQVLAGRHDLTGHWPAPELTLPKLLALQATEPDRWAATRRVLFVHDWLLWLLSGEQATEASYACAGGMADVAARNWADGLLQECGLGTDRLAPVVEAGVVVGRTTRVWPLPAGLPVVSGCGDTQLAAMGVGGLGDGVVTVVAGSSTPVQVATSAPVHDPLGRPWVSTHAAPGLWAAEGNAGYPGTVQGWWTRVAREGGATADRGSGGVVAVTAAEHWAQDTWSSRPPTSLVGLRPDTTTGDVRQALLEAHAFSVRGNVEDLTRALGRTPSAVVVTGGGAADGELPRLLAQVLGREVHHATAGGAATAGAALVARALGENTFMAGLPEHVLPGGDASVWAAPYERWRATTAALRSALAASWA